MENFEESRQITLEQQTRRGLEMPEEEITPEQKEILESAIKFAEYLTNRWPQVDSGMKTEQRINYYICGSLAVMLLSNAEIFSEIDEAQISTLVEFRTREITESARKILASFARQIGDLDYVPIKHYKANSERLKKGGGGPSFDEVPEEGQKVLKRKKDQIKVMCDPCENFGVSRIAKVNVEGRDYYIARPDTMLAYKVLHILQSYENNPEKFNADFDKLLGALKEMYSEEELVQITQEVLTNYEEAMERLHIRLNEGKENPLPYEKKIPKFIERVLANQQLSPAIRAMVENLRE